MKNRMKLNYWLLLIALFCLPLGAVFSAPGTLQDKPLFSVSNVQSNVMLIIDNSTSMRGDSVDAFPEPVDTDTNHNSSSKCILNNLLAYDYTVTYTPWVGEDKNGDEFTDKTLTTMCDNPYYPDANDGDYDNRNPANTTISDDVEDRDDNEKACIINVASSDKPYFYPVLSGSDECGDETASYAGNTDGNSEAQVKPDEWTDADFGGVSGAADKAKTNYANWYSYYRRRMNIAKRAFSDVVGKSTQRVGFMGLHQDINIFTEIADMTVEDNKTALLDKVNSTYHEEGTTLRTALDEAGKYYEDLKPSWAGSPDTPITYECQQNFTLLMTDGFWGGDSNPVGIDNADGDNNSAFDGRSYADDYPDVDNPLITLADIAMHYYERDLSLLPNSVPINTAFDDLNEAQHMVTYTLAFGLDGTINASTAGTDANGNPVNRDDAFAWPAVTGAYKTETLDDVRHAAWNGRGQYLNAKNPAEITTALEAAFADINQRKSSAAAVAFNSNTLGTNSALFLAIFDSENWSGELIAYPLDPINGEIQSTASWSAQTLLDARDLTENPRVIFTYKREADNAGSLGKAFTWANVSGTSLGSDLATGTSCTGDICTDLNGSARLDFIRGDTTNEEAGLGFRDRASRLGDIVHSAPVYVGAPELNWPSPSSTATSVFPKVIDNGVAADPRFDLSDTYKQFKLDYASRTPVLYTGANDGMLHGFNANTGQEVMAYVPAFLASTSTQSGLHFLTEPNYQHRYYVDLTPTIVDAYLNSKWRTVLVGGGGLGGRGLFALDITNPVYSEADASSIDATSDPAETVLWEFSNQDYANLGYTLSKPSIVPIKQLNSGGTEELKWAVVFGNGYNSYDEDTLAFTDDASRTPTGKAELIVLFMDADLTSTTLPQTAGWTLGVDYLVIGTDIGSTDGDGDDDLSTFDSSETNGLSTPAVLDAYGSDSIADTVYAGDLKGNLWAFNLDSALPATLDSHSWQVTYESNQDVVLPLFSTPNAGQQPITTAPTVIRNSAMSTSENEPNTLIFFGSGQYLVESDIANTNAQSFYAVWDSGSGGLGINDLTAKTFLSGYPDDYRVLDSNTVAYSNNNKGWYIPLPTTGERVVTNSVVRGDIVFFNTTIPDTAACNAGGTGWLMAVDKINGGQPSEVVFDTDNNNNINDDDRVSDGTNSSVASGERFRRGIPTDPSFLGDKQYTPGSKTGSGSEVDVRDVSHLEGEAINRVSWKEVNPATGK